MFNLYYRNTKTGRLCRYSVRGLLHEQAEQHLSTFNAKRKAFHSPAWIGAH